MEFAIIISIVVLSAYLASVLCRRAKRQQRRVGWHLILASGTATGVVIVLVGCLALLSVPGNSGKRVDGVLDWCRIMLMVWVGSSTLALLPASVVFLLYRRRQKAWMGSVSSLQPLR
jgi:hypothetical protein